MQISHIKTIKKNKLIRCHASATMLFIYKCASKIHFNNYMATLNINSIDKVLTWLRRTVVDM